VRIAYLVLLPFSNIYNHYAGCVAAKIRLPFVDDQLELLGPKSLRGAAIHQARAGDKTAGTLACGFPADFVPLYPIADLKHETTDDDTTAKEAVHFTRRACSIAYRAT
jgi:hypothetical protein